MANTLNLGNGNWATKKESLLAYNTDAENGNFKPLPFDFDRASSATVINKDGLIEVVGSGEPRVDYKDDSKGALLLEPSRSNLILNSQKISLSPIKNGTFTDDFAISPDGTQNATKFTAPSIDPYFYQSVSFSAGSYTASIYVKGIGNSIGKDFRIVLGSNSSNPKLEIPSEWTRFEYTATMTGGSATAGLEMPDPAVVGDDVLVWGWQVEQGSYATSYIPTQGGIGTRVADSCVQTPPDGIINSIEGVLYAEIKKDKGSQFSLVSLDKSSDSANYIYVGYLNNTTSLRAQIKIDSVTVLDEDINIGDTNVFSKVAVKYKSGDYAFFINGSKVGNTSTSTDSFSNEDLDRLEFGYSLNSSFKYYGNVRELKLYNTALTDAELINLTTI